MSELARPLPRVFIWGAQRLPDPDPAMSPEEVRDYYSSEYPELTTAAVAVTGNEGNVQVQTFQKQGQAAQPKTHTFVNNQGARG